MPSTARPAISQPTVGAAAHSRQTTAKPSSAIRYTRRGPQRSASEPAASSSPANTTVYASTVQGSATAEECRSRRRSGSATLRIDASISTRKLPSTIPRNLRVFPDAGAAAGGAGALPVEIRSESVVISIRLAGVCLDQYSGILIAVQGKLIARRFRGLGEGAAILGQLREKCAQHGGRRAVRR